MINQPEPKPEVVIALIAPIGVDPAPTIRTITSWMEAADFEVTRHKLSTMIRDYVPQVDYPEDKVDRIHWLMDRGNELRAHDERTVAMLAMQSVAAAREENQDDSTPQRARVHIVDSLKHEEEVNFLRQVYGPAFYCISLYGDRSQR